MARFNWGSNKKGRAEGEAIGEKRGRAVIIEKMSKSGMTEEQIKAILGDE